MESGSIIISGHSLDFDKVYGKEILRQGDWPLLTKTLGFAA
jgi:hypothetical protein